MFKNRIVSSVVLVLTFLFLGSCQNPQSISIIDEPVPDQERSTSSNGIHLELQETVYKSSPVQMNVEIQNDSDQSCGYGQFYRVEIKQDDSWHMVNYPENTFQDFPYFNDMGYTLDSKEIIIQEFSLETYDLYLPEGEYRLTKTLLCPGQSGNEITLSLPFEVNE